jgi:soluble lytic murein transglycosylase-like protein
MISFRVRVITAIGILIILSAGAASADNIYRFRDENGVWHFSNINSDRRYRLYMKYRQHPTLFIKDYGPAIKEASQKFGVESSLIKAVIRAESAFDHRATSSKGAQGLMQLMPYTADYLDVDDPYDPEDNIFGGTKYLSMLLERFKNNTQLALAAYNAGPENVDAYNGVPPFQETKAFVKKVMTFYSQYKSESK